MGVVVVFRRPLSCGSIPRVGQTVKRDLGGKLSATSSGKRSVFEPLPGATILVTVRAFGFQTLGAAPAEKLPVLEPIGATPIQSRRHGRAGITGFRAFSHSLTEPQARLTPVIRRIKGHWISWRGMQAAYSRLLDYGSIGRPAEGRSKFPWRKLLVSNSMAFTGAEWVPSCTHTRSMMRHSSPRFSYLSR